MKKLLDWLCFWKDQTPGPCVIQMLSADNCDSFHPMINHRRGMPLDPGVYRFCFDKKMRYDIKLFARVQITLFNNLFKDIKLVESLEWDDSDIRIKYDEKQGWSSFTGQDIYKLTKGHWTTSFGKLYSPSYAFYAIWHELVFHCCMGAGHEHQNRRGNPIRWSEHLYVNFKERFGWDEHQVADWIVAESGDNYLGTDYDRHSNTGYFYDDKFTLNGRGSGQFNYSPSVMDLAYGQKLWGNGLTTGGQHWLEDREGKVAWFKNLDNE